MIRSVHVRLDDASAAALTLLRSEAASDSDAVRSALLEAAARRRARSALVAEVQALAADRADRAEMAQVRDHLAQLAPGAPD